MRIPMWILLSVMVLVGLLCRRMNESVGVTSERDGRRVRRQLDVGLRVEMDRYRSSMR